MYNSKKMKNGKFNIIGGWAIYKDDGLHCEDGPAKFTSEKSVGGNHTRTEYWINWKLHREDGPAIILKRGNKIILKEWWIFGNEYTEEEFKKWETKKQLNEKLQKNLNEKSKVKKLKI